MGTEFSGETAKIAEIVFGLGFPFVQPKKWVDNLEKLRENQSR